MSVVSARCQMTPREQCHLFQRGLSQSYWPHVFPLLFALFTLPPTPCSPDHHLLAPFLPRMTHYISCLLAPLCCF